MSSFYTCVPKIRIIWCMMYASWDMECDRQFFVISGHFLPFYLPNKPENQNFEKNERNTWRYHHFTQVYHEWQSYDLWSWDMNEVQQTNFFVILGHFLPFYPTNNPKNLNFEKMKKTPGGIIILHKCSKYHDHMPYCSWDMAHDGCNFYFSFRAVFGPFTPLTTWILHMCTKNYGEMMYGSWVMVRDGRTDRWTDGQTDRQTDRWTHGRTEKVTYRSGCPT